MRAKLPLLNPWIHNAFGSHELQYRISDEAEFIYTSRMYQEIIPQIGVLHYFDLEIRPLLPEMENVFLI